MRRSLSFCVALILLSAAMLAQTGGEMRFCIPSEPNTFNPLLPQEVSSATIIYLTGGVLLRVNRLTQKADPELATAWKVLDGGKKIHFQLRDGLRFSDGTPFSAEDVAYTMQKLMDPGLHSPTGDAFRSGEGRVVTNVLSPLSVDIVFPAPVANLANLFDAVPMLSSRSPQKDIAALGPFYMAEHKAGSYILLKRNPYYWKKDANGKQLPYLDAIRLEIELNKEIEALRFSRGDVQMITALQPDIFEKLASQNAKQVQDAGVSTYTEFLWFNQTLTSPIPPYKRAWFTSTAFRRAVSEAINRADMARIVFHGHAQPAIGAVSPANKFWSNAKLKPHPYDPDSALRRLRQEGFQFDRGALRDKSGNEVEFSIITVANNHARENMAAMVQQDLKRIGIKVNVVTLDFHSVIERISETFNYEACLLGLLYSDLDPNGVMNVWLSSEPDHQWNPKQKSPATSWEAEIDRLMRAQASSGDERLRKQYWDRVQEIAWEQEPFIYLVDKNALVAISPKVKNAHPSPLHPQTFWNAEYLALGNDELANRKGR
ncbi:MAG TPA: ABC transporter substrate-binding protein [Candidatus Angelobacter sp.]|nr:ABC transporter substrate-binding protein [Candidatus Angelobacter sp.]